MRISLLFPVPGLKKNTALLDISKSGMSFKYYSVKNQMVENGKYSIMTSDKRFVLENIPCKTVSDINVESFQGSDRCFH